MSGARPAPMTPERWAEVSRLFEAAAALPPEERQAFLDEACGGDADLGAEVASLLAADERAPAFLEQGAVDLVAGELEPEEPPAAVEGERLGPYRLVRELARGGMSRVFLAERVGDELHRTVAIKRLSTPGWKREDRLGRFRAEGRVLASLSHPHIAQVFDAGVDSHGDPYLVMEHVDGPSITDWCRQRGAPLERRLELVLDVCSAVEHAHRRLIVHRDLKPSNILVDPEGRVKLLDFGIAKLLDPEQSGLGEEVPPTRAGLLPMTPEYAAPEQIRGGPITTATDVYGLGLLLFELLVGRRPFDLRGRTASEVERIVCERDPVRPSTAVEAAPEAAGGDPVPSGSGGAGPVLPADLDAIVLRALAKEPERRYGSAQELAEDLRRYLAGLPVLARPSTLRYRAGKLLRRHRKAAAAILAGMLLLGALTVFYTVRLRAERDQARREAQRVAEVTALLRDVFWSADPRHASAGPRTVDELLDRAAVRVRELRTEPLIQAELLHFLALAHFGQGAPSEAEPLFEEALDLRRRHLEPPSLELVKSLNHVGWLRLARRDFPAAEALFEEALEAHRGFPGGETEDLAHSLRGLALATDGRGDHRAAEALLRRAVAILREVDGPRNLLVADALRDLGIVLRSGQRYEEAREVLEESLALRRAVGADHPEVALSLHQLALLAEDRRDPAAAAQYLGQALSIRRAAFGEDHPATRELRRTLIELRHGATSPDQQERIHP